MIWTTSRHKNRNQWCGQRIDAGCLGQDGDSALFFQIIGIHRTLIHVLVFAEHTGLFQQYVNKCCFPMINMGDYRDIAQFHDSEPWEAVRSISTVPAHSFMTASTPETGRKQAPLARLQEKRTMWRMQ